MFASPIAKIQTKTAANAANKRVDHRTSLAQSIAFQRNSSDQAELRLLESQVSTLPMNLPEDKQEQEAVRMRTLGREAAPGLSWSFGKIPLFTPDQIARAQRQSPLRFSVLPWAQTLAVTKAARQANIENGAPPTRVALPLDLAKVRMRDDASADRSTRLLGAHAFAFGNQILFRCGRYEPNTERGRALIAHELTHVAHQSQTGCPHPQRLAAGDILSVQVTQAMAEAMSDDELSQQMQLLRAHLQSEPDDAGAAQNLTVLENVAFVRQGTAQEPPGPAAAAPLAANPPSPGPGVASSPSNTTAQSGLTTGEKVLIGVLIGAAVVGGVAAILLSGGTAAPAIIVGLEAAGDVAVGTELAAGTAVAGEAVAAGEAITAGTTAASGVTTAQATGIGTAAAAAASTPQGQQVLEETGEALESLAPTVESLAPSAESSAPALESEAQIIAQGTQPIVESVATSAFSTTEMAVVDEVRAIPISQLRQAFEAGGAELNIGGRTILVDPGVPASGMTLFGEDGFIVGREAFTSDAELTKTLLHETFRLVTSQSAAGVSGEVASSETHDAFTFAERAFKAFF
jgi:Domain of unknown function (DUF4157)